MSTIHVNCADQTLKLTGTPLIAAGGINEDYINFTFCDAWNGFTKTAVFWRTEDAPYLVVLDSADTGPVPNEVLQTDGVVYFGVFGVNEDGVRRTSEVTRYNIVKGAFTEGLDPAEPTPDVYEQILAQLAATQADYESVIGSVQAAQTAAEEAAAEAAEAATAAEAAELAASQAIQTSEKGTAGGVASLDENGEVPVEQIPDLSYVPTSQVGKAGGVASLDEGGKVPADQIPELDTGAKVTVVQVTLSEAWTSAGSSTTPSSSVCDYYQTVTVAGVTADNAIVVGLASTATAAQREAAEKGKIFAYSQAADSIVVCVAVDATRPEVELPITVMIWA